MRKGQKLTTTEKMDRAREMTKRLAARELLYGVMFSHIWPTWLHPTDNADYPYIMVVDSPAGKMTWRVADDETAIVEHMERREHTSQRAIDRTPMLLHLATEGW